MALSTYVVELLGTGSSWLDISAYVRSVTTNRGRSRELDKFEAGQFSVSLLNHNRYFDPTYTDSTTRTNLHPNPSAEVDITGYAASNMTISRSTLYSSSNVLGTCTSTGTNRYIDYSSRINVTQGNTYTFSTYIYFPAGNASDATVQLQLHPHNGTAYGGPTTSATQVITRGTWTRMSVTATATTVSGLPTTSMLPRVLITSSFTSGNTMHIDDSLFEQSSTLDSYFDGSTSDTNYQFYSWNGTAGLSTSTLLQYNTPFFGCIVPRRRMRIKANSIVVFNGYVADWNLSYDVSGESIATVTGFDAFIYLTNQILPTLSNAAGLSGARIYALATYAGIQWPGGSLDINDGLVTVQADTIAANTNSLEYFQLLERTERGFLFMSADNALTYYNYASTGTPSPSVSLIEFSDAGATGYQNLDVVYGSELLYNTVVLSRVSGGTVTVQDTASITVYGESVYSDDGLLLNSDTDLTNQALMIAGKYSSPEYRFDSVTVMMNPLGSITQGYLLGIELGDFVKVTFTPNQVGSAISRYVRVIGIEHQMEIDQHNITYRFADVVGDTLVLDNDALGQLDYNVLGF